jgi:hypothetical protein
LLLGLAAGVAHIFTCADSFGSLRLFLANSLSAQSSAVGVRHNPYSVSSVSGVDGASWNNKRLHGVAFTFQVRNTVVEFHRDESSNVLTNDPSGPGFAYNPEHFRPERTVIRRASSLPGLGKWLAWKPSGKQSCAPVSGSVELSNVSE